MFTIKEKQRVDRELFSELLESPVYSAFLNMTRPLRGSLNPLFYLRINGKALREWRRLKNPDEVFDALQCNLRRIGYTLSSCCRARVGKAVHSRVEYTVKKVNQASNGNIRRAVKSNYWASLSLLPEEPDGMIEELLNRQQEWLQKTKDYGPRLKVTIYIFYPVLKQCNIFFINPKCLHFYQSGLINFFLCLKIKHHSFMTLYGQAHSRWS